MMETTNQMGAKAFQHINLDYLNLMADGDQSMKKVMLGMLLEELPEEITKLRTMNDAQNYDDLRSVSHKLKSTLAFVGNEVLTETNKEIEEIAKTKENTNMLPFMIEVIENGYKKAVIELNEVLASL